MDHANMLTLLEGIREEYREHGKDVSTLVTVVEGSNDKARYVALQATARDCTDALEQAITLLSQPTEGERVAQLEAEVTRLRRGLNRFATLWVSALEIIKERDPEYFEVLFEPFLEQLLALTRKGD